jgi:hypothetical protein
MKRGVTIFIAESDYAAVQSAAQAKGISVSELARQGLYEIAGLRAPPLSRPGRLPRTTHSSEERKIDAYR